MMIPSPVHLQQWIDTYKNELLPPIGNKVVWANSELIVMVVGGPNSRKDFHVDPGPEFFYQLKGDIQLRVVEKGKIKNISIREGEMFCLPSKMPHQPIRPKNTLGLVIERKRKPTEKESFQWYCESCSKKIAQVNVLVKKIDQDLPGILATFYKNEKKRTCKHCGHVMVPPAL
jgi:3-hydroxyanthranilate 3,4-dioxygenase